MKYEYTATYGDYYKIKSFKGFVPLKLDHIELLNGKVYYNSPKTLRIETTLLYDVGQKVSIGGYLINRRNFNLIELSITDNPVLDKAEIIKRKVIEE
jgi:hypothetical protein